MLLRKNTIFLPTKISPIGFRRKYWCNVFLLILSIILSIYIFFFFRKSRKKFWKGNSYGPRKTERMRPSRSRLKPPIKKWRDWKNTLTSVLITSRIFRRERNILMIRVHGIQIFFKIKILNRHQDDIHQCTSAMFCWTVQIFRTFGPLWCCWISPCTTEILSHGSDLLDVSNYHTALKSTEIAKSNVRMWNV